MPDPLVVPESSHAIVLTEVAAMGGAERSCLALGRWLYEHGIPCHFVTYEDRVGLERFASYPVQVIQLKPKMDAIHKVRALNHYFKSHPRAPKPLTSGYQPALHTTLAGGRGFHCLMHDTPSLFSDGGKGSSIRGRLGRLVSDKITGYGLRSGGQTIVTSTYLQEETERVFGIRPAIARMGGLSQMNAFRLRPIGASLRMLSVSRVEANKRIDWMVRALAALEHGANPLSAKIDWRLEVAGKGSYLAPLKTLTQELKIDHRVHFHGFVSDEELQDLYDSADLFLMPAVQGYGIPAIESLQRGIPLLLHRESGVSDILLDTPWATVLEGGEDAMLPALARAINSVCLGEHLTVPLPTLPTEDSWAAEVARLCGWV